MKRMNCKWILIYTCENRNESKNWWQEELVLMGLLGSKLVGLVLLNWSITDLVGWFYF